MSFLLKLVLSVCLFVSLNWCQVPLYLWLGVTQLCEVRDNSTQYDTCQSTSQYINSINFWISVSTPLKKPSNHPPTHPSNSKKIMKTTILKPPLAYKSNTKGSTNARRMNGVNMLAFKVTQVSFNIWGKDTEHYPINVFY